MKRLLRKLLNALAYTVAGLVIALAIFVGLFRLFLPRLPEYQEDIKAWANDAIGMQVEFSGMNARWRLSGPELNFYDASLTLPDSEEALVQAEEVTIGVGLLRLVVDRALVVDRILVRDTSIDIEKTAGDSFSIQGFPADELADLLPTSGDRSDIDIVARDIDVSYVDASGEQRIAFEIASAQASRDTDELSVEATIALQEAFGGRLEFSAQQIANVGAGPGSWQVFLEGRGLGLARWSSFAPETSPQLASGSGDVSLWLEISEQTIQKATANFVAEELVVRGSRIPAPFGADGRFEFTRADDGFLLAAENFRFRTAEFDWPRSNLQLQAEPGADGTATSGSINASATFLRLDDLAYVAAALPENLLTFYERYRPTGTLRDVRIATRNNGVEAMQFDVTASLSNVGFNAHESLPGIRNFSGVIRADSAGGRVEFDAGDFGVSVPQYVAQELQFDDAAGTVIWRRSGNNLTVLSDRLQLSNADFDSQSSLQLTLPGDDDASPIVDLQSTWSINSVDAAKRYLPQPIIASPLYRWLQDALVSGRLTDGSARLIGSLDDFPFDEGDGEFRITATLRDAVMRYGNNWPAANINTMDVVLDGLRLYSEKNIAFTAGNATTDALVAIDDLREPVLTIDAFSTGTLNTIRDYARESPIANVFGGKLDTVSVDGDASFNLLLELPLKDRQAYDFTARIQVADGTLMLDGFAPPLSELNGIVVVSRDELQSESLFGRFLGEPLTIELNRLDEPDSGYGIVAEAEGRVTPEGLVNELGAPVQGLAAGAAEVEATVRFPRAGLDAPPPVRISLQSDLDGLLMDLPAPLYKEAAQRERLSMVIEFPEAGSHLVNGQPWRFAALGG